MTAGPLPTITASVQPDGSAQVSVDGTSYPAGGATEGAGRQNVVRFIAARVAAQRGQPVVAAVDDAAGRWELSVFPDGSVSVLRFTERPPDGPVPVPPQPDPTRAPTGEAPVARVAAPVAPPVAAPVVQPVRAPVVERVEDAPVQRSAEPVEAAEPEPIDQPVAQPVEPAAASMVDHEIAAEAPAGASAEVQPESADDDDDAAPETALDTAWTPDPLHSAPPADGAAWSAAPPPAPIWQPPAQVPPGPAGIVPGSQPLGAGPAVGGAGPVPPRPPVAVPGAPIGQPLVPASPQVGGPAFTPTGQPMPMPAAPPLASTAGPGAVGTPYPDPPGTVDGRALPGSSPPVQARPTQRSGPPPLPAGLAVPAVAPVPAPEPAPSAAPSMAPTPIAASQRAVAPTPITAPPPAAAPIVAAAPTASPAYSGVTAAPGVPLRPAVPVAPVPPAPAAPATAAPAPPAAGSTGFGGSAIPAPPATAGPSAEPTRAPTDRPRPPGAPALPERPWITPGAAAWALSADAGPASPGGPDGSAPAGSAPPSALAQAQPAGQPPLLEQLPAPAPTLDSLLAARPAPASGPATMGWQGVVRTLTGGLIKPAPGSDEVALRLDTAAVQRPLNGPRTIAVVNPKGGAHKTTTTLLLAATLGSHRGGYTLAWDNNETRGTLGWRAQPGQHTRTAVDLLRDLERFGDARGVRAGDLDGYVRSQGDARFDVLASDEDAASAASVDREAFLALHRSLSRLYRIIVVDTGNNMRAGNWQAALDKADQLVIVSTVREDTGQSAAWMVDALRSAGRHHAVRNAVTVLSAASRNDDRGLADRLRQHFGQLTRAVVEIPHDDALVAGGPIDLAALSPASRRAWLRVAAAVVDGL